MIPSSEGCEKSQENDRIWLNLPAASPGERGKTESKGDSALRCPKNTRRIKTQHFGAANALRKSNPNPPRCGTLGKGKGMTTGTQSGEPSMDWEGRQLPGALSQYYPKLTPGLRALPGHGNIPPALVGRYPHCPLKFGSAKPAIDGRGPGPTRDAPKKQRRTGMNPGVYPRGRDMRGGMGGGDVPVPSGVWCLAPHSVPVLAALRDNLSPRSRSCFGDRKMAFCGMPTACRGSSLPQNWQTTKPG